MRSPSRQERTRSRPAEPGGIEVGAIGPLRLGERAGDLGPDLPVRRSGSSPAPAGSAPRAQPPDRCGSGRDPARPGPRRRHRARPRRPRGPGRGARSPRRAPGRAAPGRRPRRSARARSASRRSAGGSPARASAPITPPASAPGRPQRLGREPLQRLRLLGELRLGLGDHLLGCGAELPQHRQHLVPDPVAGVERLGVGRVVAEGEPRLGDERPHPLAVQSQQRADDDAAARAKAEQRPSPGRGRQAVEDGLGEVGPGVAGGHPVESPLPAQSLGRRVARLARLGLHVSLAEPRPLDHQLDAEPLAELAAGRFVLVGVWAEPVVEMQGENRIGSQDPGQTRSQGGRIGSAGAERDPRAALRDHAARSDRFCERLERRASHMAQG